MEPSALATRATAAVDALLDGYSYADRDLREADKGGTRAKALISVPSRAGGDRLFLDIQLTAADLDRGQFPAWVSLFNADTEDEVGRPSLIPYTFDQARTLLRVWAQHTDRAQRWRAFAEVARGLVPLSELFQRAWKPLPVCPGEDGYVTLGDYTEPYPGAWPAEPAGMAQRGDLSALWPYLTH